ncbi:unnamed protein product [Tilletia laevis]|uniref:Uncharacterized protein n=1 Tax=Tilletia laevis TaxID=157183 RepID=A0A9N8M953_9BASI|nr:unnamed protein product [Tilletia laevis]
MQLQARSILERLLQEEAEAAAVAQQFDAALQRAELGRYPEEQLRDLRTSIYQQRYRLQRLRNRINQLRATGELRELYVQEGQILGALQQANEQFDIFVRANNMQGAEEVRAASIGPLNERLVQVRNQIARLSG